MERIEFLIEETHVRVPCMLNPESLTIERSSGAQRAAGQLVSHRMTDNPIYFSGRGDTRFKLELLFDVAISNLPLQTSDVRDLTDPLWLLTEYRSADNLFDELPAARFIWGRAWNIRVIIESISQKFLRFSRTGVPESALLSISLLRVSEDEGRGRGSSWPIPCHPTLRDADLEGLAEPAPEWGVHQFLAEERLEQLAGQYYDNPALWRLIAVANGIGDPLRIPAGTMLQIPPLSVIKRQSDGWDSDTGQGSQG